MVLIALLFLLVVAPLAGWTYERYAMRRDARRYPPPGRLVDVGGHRLHLVCIGSGSPLVMFEVSGFSNSTSFSTARAALAGRTRVCTYDRMGIGWSDPAPAAVSAGALVDDLRRLLDAADIRSPIVLVASSIGGLTVELFARRYPDRVAGAVFLDAANSEAITRYERDRLLRTAAPPGCGIASAAGAIGVMRLLDPWNFREVRTDERLRSAALMYGSKPWRMLCAMIRAYETTRQEFAAAPPLDRQMPLTVLSAEHRGGFVPPALARFTDVDNSFVSALHATHQRLAKQSARGRWRLVRGSGHLIASDKPQAAVDAVLETISESARTTGR